MGGNGGNGRQRETRGGNGGQRETTGSNGRQRETTENNGFLTVFVKTFRFVAEQAVRYNPRANPGEHGLSVVLGMHMHSRVSTMHSRVRIRDTSAILVNPWMSRLITAHIQCECCKVYLGQPTGQVPPRNLVQAAERLGPWLERVHKSFTCHVGRIRAYPSAWARFLIVISLFPPPSVCWANGGGLRSNVGPAGGDP